MRRQEAGISLLEMMLVLTICAGILMMGMQVYLTMRRDADIRQVQTNVDAIFQAMDNYYRINCYGQSRANQTVIPGTLHPASSPATQFKINITTQLIQPGLLPASALVQTPLVDVNAPQTTQGYLAQFNKKTSPRMVCTTGAGAANSPTCTGSTSAGTVTEWQAQVAVQLDATPATTPGVFLTAMGGHCLSTRVGTTVTPCSAITTGSFVVWERTPSSSSKEGGSTYWQTIPTVKQFTQMYTTYPMNSLTSGAITNQNFLCGN